MINEHKRKTHILVLGLDSVGKSMLIKRLLAINSKKVKEDLAIETNPTTGFDTNTLRISGKDYFINEVGASMISNWHKYVSDTLTLIFVVDLSNHAQLSAAMVEF